MRSTPEEAHLLTDFDFALPEELIAQYPAATREGSRLMVLERRSGTVACRDFPAVVEYFRAGDVLVVNDTRVIPARLLGQKETGGRVEVLLVRREAGDDEVWHCLVRASKAPRPGGRLQLPDGLQATVLSGGEEPYRRLLFTGGGDSFLRTLERSGRIPLPPYIRRDADAVDRERYQTVFAAEPGAVAAPTAGLHFTQGVLDRLRAKGVRLCSLTLHVGLGTFLPVRSDNLDAHRMHRECYRIPPATATLLNQARAEGRRIFALGTTTTRALEHVAAEHGRIEAGAGETEIFIRPGHQFRAVDALITNFHLPQSTLLMLVAAFAGREFVLAAYRQAVAERFRFFSYGDCMLIV